MRITNQKIIPDRLRPGLPMTTTSIVSQQDTSGNWATVGRRRRQRGEGEGQMVVDFAKRMEMAVVNTYFKKKEEHRVMHKSGEGCTQFDFILCRRCNLKEIGECKVLAGDSVARQHRVVV
ncbi:hypothetical protein C0J50_22946 [Silurus asotus]|uniref:Uncharacterized protein n=1 Tax=Silurus asotus TaxID=30991 RepID=A0AAD5AKG0_SILAS|nr:hypothetical protein C0J50_22946 [Silurus asotus]